MNIMIKHIVLWSVKEGLDKHKVFEDIDAHFRSLVGKVPGLLSLEMHEGFQGYDICLESTHTDRAALDAYQEHPDHIALKTVVASFRASRASCDMEQDAQEPGGKT
jgi:quinol monooxygenase YgiN